MNDEIRLFDGRAREDKVQVWLTQRGGGLELRTQEWGDGIERNFGFDTIETWLTVGADAVAALASRIRSESPAAPGATDFEVIGGWLKDDSAASAHLRIRLDELGLRYEFQMR